MASLREQILARIAAALTAAAPSGANVGRAREDGITRPELPYIAVLMGGEAVTRFSQTVDKHLLRVQLAVFVRGDPWDSLADAVTDPMHRTVMADAPLQALVLDVRLVDAQPESEEADRTAGCLVNVYEVTYLTRASDLSAAPI